MVQLSLLKVQFSDKVVVVRCWSTTGAAVPQLQFLRSLTPVFAQWLIPMASAMEISQLQFDKVVLVPVVQVCSSILQVACVVDIPVVAQRLAPMVLHVADHRDSSRCRTCGGRRPCCAALQVPQVRMVQTMQYSVEALQFESGLSFFGPCTQVHGQGFPRHQGGEGVAGTPGA